MAKKNKPTATKSASKSISNNIEEKLMSSSSGESSKPSERSRSPSPAPSTRPLARGGSTERRLQEQLDKARQDQDEANVKYALALSEIDDLKADLASAHQEADNQLMSCEELIEKEQSLRARVNDLERQLATARERENQIRQVLDSQRRVRPRTFADAVTPNRQAPSGNTTSTRFNKFTNGKGEQFSRHPSLVTWLHGKSWCLNCYKPYDESTRHLHRGNCMESPAKGLPTGYTIPPKK